ncbi:MAG TPA: hypothetical protein VIU12_08430 [Chryseolinea sp.]
MAKNSPNVTPENVTEWLASTGFIFPRTLAELARFEKLHSEIADEKLPAEGFDPDVILGIKSRAKTVQLKPPAGEEETPRFRMAARKGDTNIADHIMDKIKKNQDSKKNDPGSPKE